MIAEKINSAVYALQDLEGRISRDDWQIIFCAQKELEDAAEQVGHIEKTITLADLEGGK